MDPAHPRIPNLSKDPLNSNKTQRLAQFKQKPAQFQQNSKTRSIPTKLKDLRNSNKDPLNSNKTQRLAQFKQRPAQFQQNSKTRTIQRNWLGKNLIRRKREPLYVCLIGFISKCPRMWTDSDLEISLYALPSAPKSSRKLTHETTKPLCNWTQAQKEVPLPGNSLFYLNWPFLTKSLAHQQRHAIQFTPSCEVQEEPAPVLCLKPFHPKVSKLFLATLIGVTLPICFIEEDVVKR